MLKKKLCSLAIATLLLPSCADSAMAGITSVNGANGTIISITATSERIGDVKYGYQPSDHNGWILLDGRVASGNLTVTQTANAVALGVLAGGNIPDMRVRSLVGASIANPINSIRGTATVALTQANLPNVSLTATGASAGTPAVTISSDSAGTPSGTESSNSAGTPSGTISSNSAGTPTGTTDIAGAHTHSATVTFHDTTGGGFNGGRIQSTDRSPVRVQTNASEVAIQSAGNHTHTFTGSAMPGHSHSFAGTALGGHTHTFTGNALPGHSHTATGSVMPAHAHAVPLGGSGTAVNVQSPVRAINTFVYLGV